MRWCHFNYWRQTRVFINCNHSKPMLRFVSLVETIFTQMCATRHRENLESKMNNSGYDVHVWWYKNLAIRHNVFFFSFGAESHFNFNIPICASSTVLSMSKFYVEINVSNFISRSLKSWNVFSNSALRNPYFLVEAQLYMYLTQNECFASFQMY